MVQGDVIGWHIESWKKNAVTVLQASLADGRLSEGAKELVNELGRRGFHEYRPLLGGGQPPPMNT